MPCLISTTFTIQLVLGEDVAREVAKLPKSAASQKLIFINMINVCRVYLQHIHCMV